MISFFRKSIARKVALIVGSSCLLVVVVGLAGMMFLFQADIRDHARNSIDLLSEAIAYSFSDFDRVANRHLVQAHVAEMHHLEEMDQVRVFDRTGKVVWSLHEDEVGHPLPPEPLWAFRKGLKTHLEDEDGESLGLVRQLRARRGCLECHASRSKVSVGGLLGGIHLEASQKKLTSRLNSYAHLQMLTALMLVAFVTLVTALALRIFVSSPLQKLDRALKAAEEGNFLHRVDVSGPDEVGQLAEDFNQLLAHLTEVQASKIDSEMELGIAQRELGLKAELLDKNLIIKETNRKLKKRLNELGLLFDITRALSSTLEIDRVLEVINELIGVTLKFQRFGILVMDEKRAKLEIKFVYGSTEERARVGAFVDHDVGMIGDAIRTGRRLLENDLSTRARNGPLEESLPESGSFLCIPMRHRDRLLGVLNFTRIEPDAFGERECQFLTSMARQAAMAILNAQLYQEKLEMSVTDELTRLANRRRMQDHLDMEWDRATRFGNPLSLLMIDIDHFKRYNDINGHMLGDQVLVEVARALERNTRKVDTVARFGGEEFVIILPGQNKAAAASVAEKLRSAIAEGGFPRADSLPAGRLSITVGVASWPEDVEDARDLIDRADLAMYVAKHAGRNQVKVYEEGMQIAEGDRKKIRASRRNRKRRRRRRPPSQGAARTRTRSRSKEDGSPGS